MQSNKVLHIIVEGVDGTGKSTVVKKLSEMLDLRIIRLQDMDKYFKKGITEEISESFNKTLVQFKDVAWIADRGFPSSLVYSLYFLRKYDLRYIDEVMKELDARIFILDVAPRVVDNLITHHEQDQIRGLYLKLADKYNWTVLSCTGRTPEDICAMIIKEIKKDASK